MSKTEYILKQARILRLFAKEHGLKEAEAGAIWVGSGLAQLFEKRYWKLVIL